MTQLLRLEDLNTTIDGEPRMRDLTIADALEMRNRHDIRTLIRRHSEPLESFGSVISRPDEKLPGAGRPGASYWLNRKQALFIVAKSETPRAAEITVQMVEIYDQYLQAVNLAQPEMVQVQAHERRTSTKVDDAIRLKTNVDRAEQVAARLETALDRMELAGNFGRYIHPDVPVTHGDLVEYIRRADDAWKQNQGRFGFTLLSAIEDAMGNPMEGPPMAHTRQPHKKPASNSKETRARREAMITVLQTHPHLTDTEIADIVGINRATVWSWRRKIRYGHMHQGDSKAIAA